ncbi:hypothetical protein GCM10027176_17610 [Actinoallomurus bryophytorum]
MSLGFRSGARAWVSGSGFGLELALGLDTSSNSNQPHLGSSPTGTSPRPQERGAGYHEPESRDGPDSSGKRGLMRNQTGPGPEEMAWGWGWIEGRAWVTA